MVLTPTGALLPPVAMIEQSKRFCLAAKASERTRSGVDVHSGRLEKVLLSAPPGARLEQNPRRYGGESKDQAYYALGGRAEVLSPLINPAAWPAHSLPPQAFDAVNLRIPKDTRLSTNQDKIFPFNPLGLFAHLSVHRGTWALLSPGSSL